MNKSKRNYLELLTQLRATTNLISAPTPPYTAAFSNSGVLVEDQVAADDKVVTRFIVHSTHDRGELMGLAPTAYR